MIASYPRGVAVNRRRWVLKTEGKKGKRKEEEDRSDSGLPVLDCFCKYQPRIPDQTCLTSVSTSTDLRISLSFDGLSRTLIKIFD